jgi:FkbM family methyltransferase
MTGSIAVAWDKLIFCWRICADPSSFFRLVSASKIFSLNRNRVMDVEVKDSYHMQIAGKKAEITLRRFAGDIDIFFEVFWKLAYSDSRMNKKTISTVLDLGANIGMATAYFYSRFPGAVFYCVEPDPDSMLLMKNNLAQLVPSDQIQFLTAAAGAADSRGEMVTARYAYNRSVRPNPAKGEVKILTIASILSHFNLQYIDLLKLDIEGAESDILQDAGWLTRVHFIFIEFHSEAGMNNGIARLEEKGFSWKKCKGNDMLIFAENSIF